jgi:hypothetical protein
VGSIVAGPLQCVALTAAEGSQCMVAAGSLSVAAAELSYEALMAVRQLSRAVLIASVRATAAASGTERGGATGADGGGPMAWALAGGGPTSAMSGFASSAERYRFDRSVGRGSPGLISHERGANRNECDEQHRQQAIIDRIEMEPIGGSPGWGPAPSRGITRILY